MDHLDEKDFILEVHWLVVASGVPNYMGCRIPLLTKLNIPFLRDSLSDYYDKEIVDFMEFSFPLGVVGEAPDNPPCQNHSGQSYSLNVLMSMYQQN